MVKNVYEVLEAAALIIYQQIPLFKEDDGQVDDEAGVLIPVASVATTGVLDTYTSLDALARNKRGEVGSTER